MMSATIRTTLVSLTLAAAAPAAFAQPPESMTAGTTDEATMAQQYQDEATQLRAVAEQNARKAADLERLHLDAGGRRQTNPKAEERLETYQQAADQADRMADAAQEAADLHRLRAQRP
jgi:hypothetical protein